MLDGDSGEHDPHRALFGDQPGPVQRPRPRPVPRYDDHDDDDDDHHHDHQHPHRHKILLIAAAAIALVLAIVVWLVILPIFDDANEPDDYSGAGSGTAVVEVRPGDGAEAIAEELRAEGVIATTDPFVQAARDDPRSTGIQAGSYTMPKRLPAKQALANLLDGRHKARGLLVPEGATVFDVEKRLVKPRCTAGSADEVVCGLGVSAADVRSALAGVAELGIPTNFVPASGRITTAEGFLFPLTYTFEANASAADALHEMVSAFIERARATDFAAGARELKLTPYQALIIASIAQSEGKFADELPKIARVILNRIKAGMPLQIDNTSGYGCLLLKQTPCIYSEVDSPYNSYLHRGLPPTPISNPGEDALTAAVAPADGTWLYYVKSDATGHHYFTDDPDAFEAAKQKCIDNGWGCG